MHNKVCKMVWPKASNVALKGELGRFSLHLIIYTRIFKYFLRLLTLQNNEFFWAFMVYYCKAPVTLYQIKWLYSKSAISWLQDNSSTN